MSGPCVFVSQNSRVSAVHKSTACRATLVATARPHARYKRCERTLRLELQLRQPGGPFDNPNLALPADRLPCPGRKSRNRRFGRLSALRSSRPRAARGRGQPWQRGLVASWPRGWPHMAGPPRTTGTALCTECTTCIIGNFGRRRTELTGISWCTAGRHIIPCASAAPLWSLPSKLQGHTKVQPKCTAMSRNDSNDSNDSHGCAGGNGGCGERTQRWMDGKGGTKGNERKPIC